MLLLLRLIPPLLSIILLIGSLSWPLPCSAFIVGGNNSNNNYNQQQITTTRSMITTRTDRRPPFLLQGYYSSSRSRRRQKPTAVVTTTISSDRSSKRITSRSETQLSLHPVTPTTIGSTAGASLALIGSSLFGIQIEKIIPSSGILATLLSSAFFGNFVSSRWVPTKHPLYDLCFTLFLPGSLALLLLAYRPPSSSSSSSSSSSLPITSQEMKERVISPQDDATQNSISACILRIAMPFLIASISSLFGCWLSYRCALALRWFHGSIEYAKITTGCMSASYVGGSVNFMATARLIGAPANLLGSLVTSDLLTMSIYFSFLSSSLDWKWLVSKFSHTTAPTKTNQITTIATKSNGVKEYAQKGKGEKKNSLNDIHYEDDDNIAPNLRSVYLASVPLLISTYFIVNVANRVENVVGRFVPGAACAIIAIVAPILNSLVQNKTYWKSFSIAATAWSDFFFLSFFASIGIAANLSSALSMGPACLLFSTIALTVHVLGTTFGCAIWNRLVLMFGRRGGAKNNNNILSLDLEDVWIASNAAIGGPATAAAFCGRMKKRDPGKLQGRTIAATVWGVVGYAIGSFVGVSMYRMI
jgi:uncharacterized membrane protein